MTGRFAGLAPVLMAAGLFAAVCGDASAQTTEGPLLTFGVTGSVSSQGMENPTNLLARRQVQALVLSAASGGVTEEAARQALAGGNVELAHLVNAGLLREASRGRFVIHFNLITAADRARIDQVLEPYAQSLAQAFLRRQHRFETLLARYDLPGVDRGDLAFALIGCVGLDWDGLDVTAEGGYRTPAQPRANGDAYVVWAHEQAPNVTYRGLYWGSHNSQRGTAWLTTFGDHDALPRSGLPDALWEATSAVYRARLTEPARDALYNLAEPRFEAMLGRAALVMIRLREGPATEQQLARVIDGDEAAVREIAALLLALNYVRETSDGYVGAVPIFTERDRAMIEAVRAETRAIMIRWLHQNATGMKRDLDGLTALQAGVPYEQLFTEVWHYLFGNVNARLSAAGAISDPYALNTTWRGFVPFVWEDRLGLN